ncbi:hypothetical protein GCM10028774_37670 [Spirosoma jeollabukense]
MAGFYIFRFEESQCGETKEEIEKYIETILNGALEDLVSPSSKVTITQSSVSSEGQIIHLYTMYYSEE